MAELLRAGDQVPVIPLLEVVGNGANVSPMHMGATAVNVGTVVAGFSVIISVAVVAHCPEFGVKVYVVVAELLGAGDQVPVIPLLEVIGSGAST